MRVLLYGFMQKYGELSLDYPYYSFFSGALVDYLHVLAQQKKVGKPSETASIKWQVSPKTSYGK